MPFGVRETALSLDFASLPTVERLSPVKLLLNPACMNTVLFCEMKVSLNMILNDVNMPP